jgi:SAM-dependent methyltransferase
VKSPRHARHATAYFDAPHVVRRYAVEPRLHGGERRFFEEQFPEGMEGVLALDVGCGAGRFTRYLLDAGARVVGVDLSEKLLQLAASRYPPARFARADATALPFEEGRFDVVACAFNGLDYVAPQSMRRAALRESLRVLRRGGLFLFSSHSLPALVFGLPRHLGRPRSLAKGLLYAARQAVAGNLFRAEVWIPDIVDGLQTYYGRPSRVIRDVNAAGFELVSVRPNLPHLERCRELLRTDALTRLAEPWPYYLCRKPGPAR